MQFYKMLALTFMAAVTSQALGMEATLEEEADFLSLPDELCEDIIEKALPSEIREELPLAHFVKEIVRLKAVNRGFSRILKQVANRIKSKELPFFAPGPKLSYEQKFALAARILNSQQVELSDTVDKDRINFDSFYALYDEKRNRLQIILSSYGAFSGVPRH